MEVEKSRTAKNSETEHKLSWIDLPEDLTANILQRLGAVEILETAQRVCTTWHNVCKDPFMWRIIDMKNKGGVVEKPGRLDTIFRHAVDLSQGQLIDVNIEYFGENNSIEYLTERSTQLRRLSIASCSSIEGKHLAEQIVKFPLLEELHLFYMRKSVSAGNIEAIGSSCSKLKAFTFDHKGFNIPTIRSDVLALAVAKSMPGLFHLRLVGNKLSNKGLQAILDGCPDLESLDIRKCFNVVLEDDVGKRCSQHIKSLKRPLDSTDIDQWVTFYSYDEESTFYDTANDSDYNMDYGGHPEAHDDDTDDYNFCYDDDDYGYGYY